MLQTQSEIKTKEIKQKQNADVKYDPMSWPTPSPFTYVPKYPSSTIDFVINDCKRKHRSNLQPHHWWRYGFVNTFAADRAACYKELKYIEKHHPRDVRTRPPSSLSEDMARLSLADPPPCGIASRGIDRHHIKNLSSKQFVEQYVKRSRPCILRGFMDKWPARHKWNSGSLDQSDLRDARLRCGEDDAGYSVKIRLKYFLQYMHTNKDDSPLYIFDSSFPNYESSKSLHKDYEPPNYLVDDLFNYVPESKRPPYHWFLIGPERSGSSLHIDPLGTSAWNALVTGVKRWVLFPPDSSKRAAKGTRFRRRGEDGEAITYFNRVLPRIKQNELNKPNGPDLEMYEFLQYPGDVVYLPGAWWHAVLNMEHSTACTQNFCHTATFPFIWRKTRRGRKHMARRWLQTLDMNRPKQADIAHAINKNDNFEWGYTQSLDGQSSSTSGSSSPSSSSSSSEADSSDCESSPPRRLVSRSNPTRSCTASSCSSDSRLPVRPPTTVSSTTQHQAASNQALRLPSSQASISRPLQPVTTPVE